MAFFIIYFHIIAGIKKDKQLSSFILGRDQSQFIIQYYLILQKLHVFLEET